MESTTQQEATMTYRERREARAERLREWAEKREAKASAAWKTSHRISDGIPFGQPILAGHHSQRRAERDRDRLISLADKGLEHSRKAESMASRADGIESQLDRSIYSDDVDAVERLRERVAELEAQREAIKARNAAYRKEHSAELKELTAYGRDRAMPHPSYVLTNLSGNISRNRKRLAQLERQA